MSIKFLKTEVLITFPFALLMAVLLACDKTGMMSVSVIAVVLHELGHLAVLYYQKCPPQKIKLQLIGVGITQTRLLTDLKSEALVAAAGPAANLITSFSLLPFIDLSFPAALCAAGIVIGGFNLLPLTGLDGGDVLRCLLSMKLQGGLVNIITKAVNAVVILLIASFGIFLFVSDNRNPTMLIAAVYLAIYVIIKRR